MNTIFLAINFIEKNWRTLALLCLIVVCFGSGWWMGSSNVQQKWDLAVSEQSRHSLAQAVTQAKAETQHVEKEAEVTIQVVTKYVDRVRTIVKKGEDIVKEVPIYVTEENDRQCDVPVSFGVLWNAANQEQLPSSSGDADASTDHSGHPAIDHRPSGIRLSDISRQHIVESGICKQTEEQLIALQNWVREQYNLDHPNDPLPPPEYVDPIPVVSEVVDIPATEMVDPFDTVSTPAMTP